MENISKQLLIKSGWYPNRNICLLKIRLCIYYNNLNLHNAAKKTLREFGLLYIYDDVNLKKPLIHFDPCKALREVDSSWIKKDYMLRINCNELCVIGQAYGNYMIICMDEKGNIYGGYDDLLYFISNDINDLIDRVYNKTKLIEIP